MISRAGVRSHLDAPGSVAGAARVIAAARQGIASVPTGGGTAEAVRIGDIVMIELLDRGEDLVDSAMGSGPLHS